MMKKFKIVERLINGIYLQPTLKQRIVRYGKTKLRYQTHRRVDLRVEQTIFQYKTH